MRRKSRVRAGMALSASGSAAMPLLLRSRTETCGKRAESSASGGCRSRLLYRKSFSARPSLSSSPSEDDDEEATRLASRSASVMPMKEKSTFLLPPAPLASSSLLLLLLSLDEKLLLLGTRS